MGSRRRRACGASRNHATMRTILTVSVENFLSFRKSEVKLGSLNVLVGPNGAGKTNFLKIFQFLGDVARLDLIPAIDGLGGFRELRFRGRKPTNAKDVRLILRGMMTEHADENTPDEYDLACREDRGFVHESSGGRLADQARFIRTETIRFNRGTGPGRQITLQGRCATFATVDPSGQSAGQKGLHLSVQPQSAGLNTIRKLGDEYDAPDIEALAQVLENFRLFDVNVAKIRQPASRTSTPSLASDGSNVVHFLLTLERDYPAIFERLCDDIQFVLPGFEEFRFHRVGGADDATRLAIKERHINGDTPLARASFGTIRAIALFAMLHDPNPPRITCIEEIDHGFHPHALDRVVERVREASERTQIIVATHSPALVNRLEPGELIIFERDANTGATRIVELDPAQAGKMEDESGYRMGELWFSGILGGGLGQEA